MDAGGPISGTVGMCTSRCEGRPPEVGAASIEGRGRRRGTDGPARRPRRGILARGREGDARLRGAAGATDGGRQRRHAGAGRHTEGLSACRTATGPVPPSAEARSPGWRRWPWPSAVCSESASGFKGIARVIVRLPRRCDALPGDGAVPLRTSALAEFVGVIGGRAAAVPVASAASTLRLCFRAASRSVPRSMKRAIHLGKRPVGGSDGPWAPTFFLVTSNSTEHEVFFVFTSRRQSRLTP